MLRDRAFFNYVESPRQENPSTSGVVLKARTSNSNSLLATSIGSSDDIRLGDMVIVKRDNDIVGLAQIIRAYDNESIGMVTKLFDDSIEVQAGDLVEVPNQ